MQFVGSVFCSWQVAGLHVAIFRIAAFFFDNILNVLTFVAYSYQSWFIAWLLRYLPAIMMSSSSNLRNVKFLVCHHLGLPK